MCNGITGKTIDIVEDRKLNNLLKYFTYYSFDARKKVKYIVIDMYSPYITLIKKMFPNSKIIIDKFHLVNLISTSLNKTRIKAMKTDKINYNKLKRYWKLLLKEREKLNNTEWRKFTCFNDIMNELDVVNYIIDTNEELKNTYNVYQDLLTAFKTNNYEELEETINKDYLDISDYMKTSVKTIKLYLPYIKNTLENTYHNGYIEGNHTFIKTLKRIAFGYKSFRRFKIRILICKNLLQLKKANAILALT